MRDEIEEFLAQGKAEGWSDDTLQSYRERLGYLERFAASLRREGWKRSSRRSILSTARTFFGWLAERGKLLSNPARDLRVEHEDQEELPAPPLSMDEVAVLLDGLPRRNAIDLRNRALLELLYGCGLRLSEALALDLGDIELANKTLHVRKGKGAKERDLPLGRVAIHAVRDYLALRRSLLKGPDNGIFLLDRFGRRVTEGNVRSWFQNLNRASGPKAQRLHPHLFRHSIAVHLLQNGADVRYVQQFLGHEKLDTTKIYLRLVPGRLKEDYDKAFPDIAVNT